MTNRIFALILGGQTPEWDAPAPPDYPRRTLGWYLDRCRDAKADRERRGSEQLDAHRRAARGAQRIIDEAPRHN